MTDCLLLAADHHPTAVSPERVAAVCAGLGLRRAGALRWVLAAGGDHVTLTASVDRPPGTVCLIRCSPVPADPVAIGAVLEVAAAVGFRVTHSGTRYEWRQAGRGVPAVSGEAFEVTLVSTAEPVHSIACLPDGRVLVGRHARAVGAPRLVVELPGGRERSDLGVPVVASPDGRLLAAGGGAFPLRIAGSTAAGRAVAGEWSVARTCAWLPGSASTLIAMTRHHGVRQTPPTAPDPRAAAALAGFESERDQRLLAIDVATGDVTPVTDHRFPLAWHHRELLAVTGDVAFVADRTRLWAVSVATGEVLWSDHSTGTLTDNPHRWALAAAPCGRFVATGGTGSPTMPRSLDVREAATGRLLAGFPGRHAVRGLAFHPSGWLAAGLIEGGLLLVSPNGGVRRYGLGRGGVDAIAFTTDGGALYAGDADGGLWRAGLTSRAS